MSYELAREQLKAAIVADTSLIYQDDTLVDSLQEDAFHDFDGVFQIINDGGGEVYREMFFGEPRMYTTNIVIQIGSMITESREDAESNMESRASEVVRICMTPRASYANVVLCRPSQAPRNVTPKGSNGLIWECDFELIYTV